MLWIVLEAVIALALVLAVVVWVVLPSKKKKTTDCAEKSGIADADVNSDKEN